MITGKMSGRHRVPITVYLTSASVIIILHWYDTVVTIDEPVLIHYLLLVKICRLH